ncbi:MAG: ABC transporter ATP-binding protein [Halioglobus sp.]
MIEVTGLSRHYGALAAVDNVSFTIGASEIVGLLGHNGAGKTTIMRMLSGYLEPSAGSIVIDGTDLADDPGTIQAKLGYLPENLPVYPEMMVADYLEYAATLKGIPPAERVRAITEALASTDLQARALDPIATLSRGLKQRVGVAQAILGDPKLLILDEPTNGLDPGQTHHMRELIKRLSRRATVILSTHILQEVDALCDRVLVLANGALALDEQLDTLRGDNALHLVTDSHDAKLWQALTDLPDVVSLQAMGEEGDANGFEIVLRESADRDVVAGEVAHCVMTHGGRIARLSPLVRDLETVFSEATINEG